LRVDADNPSNAVSGIDDVLADPEAGALGGLLGCHMDVNSV
jgi:hypothetical protein